MGFFHLFGLAKGEVRSVNVLGGTRAALIEDMRASEFDFAAVSCAVEVYV